MQPVTILEEKKISTNTWVLWKYSVNAPGHSEEQLKMTWRTAFHLSSKSLDTINQKEIVFLKNTVKFHANKQGKGSNLSHTWEVFTGLFVSTTWLHTCKKNSSPKLWSFKSKLFEMAICYIKGSVNLVELLTDAVNSCIKSHLVGTSYLPTWTYTHHYCRFNCVLPTSLVILHLFWTHYNLSLNYIHLYQVTC